MRQKGFCFIQTLTWSDSLQDLRSTFPLLAKNTDNRSCSKVEQWFLLDCFAGTSLLHIVLCFIVLCCRNITLSYASFICKACQCCYLDTQVLLLIPSWSSWFLAIWFLCHLIPLWSIWFLAIWFLCYWSSMDEVEEELDEQSCWITTESANLDFWLVFRSQYG